MSEECEDRKEHVCCMLLSLYCTVTCNPSRAVSILTQSVWSAELVSVLKAHTLWYY